MRERQGVILAPSGTGFIENVPNFEKEFLPGYHDLVDTWVTSLPHEDVKGGFFSSSTKEDSEGQESGKETSQKEWSDSIPSKRTLINLSIFAALTLGLLFYRIRGGHFSK